MIATADIFAGVKLLWESSILPQIVPGGLWEGRAKEGASDPYAVATLDAEDPEYFTGNGYIQVFTLTLSVWSSAGVTNAKQIQQAMQSAFHHDRVTQLVVLSASRVVELHMHAGTVKTEEGIAKDSKDVKLTAGKWEITLQGQL